MLVPSNEFSFEENLIVNKLVNIMLTCLLNRCCMLLKCYDDVMVYLLPLLENFRHMPVSSFVYLFVSVLWLNFSVGCS